MNRYLVGMYVLAASDEDVARTAFAVSPLVQAQQAAAKTPAGTAMSMTGVLAIGTAALIGIIAWPHVKDWI